MLHDGGVVEAILHRLLERSVYFEIRGHPCRTWHLKDCHADPPGP